jgi:hypothetical protein
MQKRASTATTDREASASDLGSKGGCEAEARRGEEEEAQAAVGSMEEEDDGRLSRWRRRFAIDGSST